MNMITPDVVEVLVKPFYDSIKRPNGENVCPENLYYDSIDAE